MLTLQMPALYVSKQAYFCDTGKLFRNKSFKKDKR